MGMSAWTEDDVHDKAVREPRRIPAIVVAALGALGGYAGGRLATERGGSSETAR